MAKVTMLVSFVAAAGSVCNLLDFNNLLDQGKNLYSKASTSLKNASPITTTVEKAHTMKAWKSDVPNYLHGITKIADAPTNVLDAIIAARDPHSLYSYLHDTLGPSAMTEVFGDMHINTLADVEQSFASAKTEMEKLKTVSGSLNQRNPGFLKSSDQNAVNFMEKKIRAMTKMAFFVCVSSEQYSDAIGKIIKPQ